MKYYDLYRKPPATGSFLTRHRVVPQNTVASKQSQLLSWSKLDILSE